MKIPLRRADSFGNGSAAASSAAYTKARTADYVDAVQATHRVGGNIDANNNYITLTLGTDFPGASGNDVKVTISDGMDGVSYDEDTNLITIVHAANSLAGVKAAVDADGGTIVSASAVTGSGAQQPAPFTEHGTFTNGADIDPGNNVLCMLTVTEATYVIISEDASKATGAAAQYMVPAGRQSAFTLKPTENMFVKNMKNDAAPYGISVFNTDGLTYSREDFAVQGIPASFF